LVFIGWFFYSLICPNEIETTSFTRRLRADLKYKGARFQWQAQNGPGRNIDRAEGSKEIRCDSLGWASWRGDSKQGIPLQSISAFVTSESPDSVRNEPAKETFAVVK